MGYNQTPVPLIVVADAKYDASGGWQKRKIRICAQGHGGNVQRGVHYFNTFAAAPNTTTTRTLQALSVKHNLVSICFDVSTAYLWGDMLDEEKIPVQYPKGIGRTTLRLVSNCMDCLRSRCTVCLSQLDGGESLVIDG